MVPRASVETGMRDPFSKQDFFHQDRGVIHRSSCE
jgi:hypothetical protein